MHIVTSHTNTDFDALASMVACTCLYPGTVGVLPSHVMPGVKAFLNIHQDLLRIRPRKNFDLCDVEGLVVVDTNQWRRLDNMGSLKARGDLAVICWDHHMAGTDIDAGEAHREEIGATVTLILEEMQRQETPFTPMQATLFLLGIYHDTGCLTFSSATPRDVRMTAFLLENGADLNLVAAYLSEAIDDPHSKVFTRMLEQARVVETCGMTIGICTLEVQSGLTMLASLVEKYKTFKGLDGVFGLFLTDQNKVMVIGRSDPRTVDVGNVVRRLGGGGHPAAGAAVVKNATIKEVETKVFQAISTASQTEAKVREMMSDPARFTLDVKASLRQAGEFMDRANLTCALVAEKDRFLGLISASVVEKAKKNNRLDTPVKSGLKRQVEAIGPDKTARTAMVKMNTSPDGLLPVIEDGTLAGVLTRGNLILHLYDI